MMSWFITLMLVGLTTVGSASQNRNANNWFTKSMDYFHYQNCSSKEKSDLTANLYSCLNSESTSENNPSDYTHYFKDYASYMNGGMSGGSSNPSIPDFINKYNPQNQYSFSNGFKGDKKQIDENSWAFKTCNELQEILRCLPKIENTQCLTQNEQKFFSTIKYFFQAQSGYVCSNKERISEAFEKSTCAFMKNRQDIQQQCYSINAQRLSYDWKVNFEDGVMCDLLKNLKNCEESYYSTCEEQVRAYVAHSWILPLQVTPCNSTLFEPMIDALSKSRRKRSTFNNQYGFQNSDLRSFMAKTDDSADEQKRNDLSAMFSGIISEMQKSNSIMSREKRSIGDASSMGGFNGMNYMDDNFEMNNNWASKFNSGGFYGSSKSNEKSKSEKESDIDDSSNPIETNKKINFDYANKFSPFRMKRSVSSFDGFYGSKTNQDMNKRFTSSESIYPEKAHNVVDQQMNINNHSAKKYSFNGMMSRSKRSADPYDESNPDEIENDKKSVHHTDEKDDDDEATKSENEKQKEFSKKINKKFSDHYTKKLFEDKMNQTDTDDEETSSPFEDLAKFIRQKIKEQQKKEAEKKKAKKTKKNENATEIKSDKVVLKNAKLIADENPADGDSDDDFDFAKELEKYIKEQIKKQMEKEKKEKKEKPKDEKKKEKMSEYEKERAQDEKERKKQREEYEKERKKDEEERRKERAQDEKERKKQREEYEKEKQKQKEEYEKEHGKKSTTSVPTTQQPTTTASPFAESTTTDDQSDETTTKDQSTTTESEIDEATTKSSASDITSTTDDEIDRSSATTTDAKSEIDATTKATQTTASDHTDSSTTLKV